MAFFVCEVGMKNKKQINLFEVPKIYKNTIDAKYTSKIKAPIYEPKGRKPFPQELANIVKSSQLIAKIEASNVTQEEKAFLIFAAYRHVIFDFHKIADYYAHASAEMQELMEESALVIIDFEAAIEGGYIKLSDDIAEQYMEEYSDGTE